MNVTQLCTIDFLEACRMHAILVTPHETNEVSAVWGERARVVGCVSEIRNYYC